MSRVHGQPRQRRDWRIGWVASGHGRTVAAGRTRASRAAGARLHADCVDRPVALTWPYDAALADGLEAAGHQVAIFGKVVGGPTHPRHDRRLCQHFYGALERRPLAGLPGHCGWRQKASAMLPGGHDWPTNCRPRAATSRIFSGRRYRSSTAGFCQAAPADAHRADVHDSAPFNNAPGSSIQRIGATQVLKVFDRVIVHTERGRRRLLQYGVGADRITRIDHGLLHGGAAGVAGRAVAAPVEDGRLELLQFGQIKPYKGIDVLIRATALLAGGVARSAPRARRRKALHGCAPAA